MQALLVLALFALPLFGPATGVAVASPDGQSNPTFFVSRNGSNGDGRSWATAWNELDQINWSVVKPGDIISIDGGADRCPALGPGHNCGMVYNTTLSVRANGAPGAPITIRKAYAAPRNGTVIIDGGLTQWSRCGEYADEPNPPAVPNGRGTRSVGVTFNNSQYVVFDGLHWGGIEVRNHSRYGVDFGGSKLISALHLKIHHNTDPTDTTNGAAGVTVGWQSYGVSVHRSEIFRNGQDAVRVAGDRFGLFESYLHDQYCNHPDGIQAFVPTGNDDVPDNAGEIRGLTIRRNIFERIGLQAIFLGENGSHQSWVVDVLIRGNLFMESDYMIKSKHGGARNWTIDFNTFYNTRDEAIQWCCAEPGAQAPMVIRDNIIRTAGLGVTAIYLPTGGGNTDFVNNCVADIGKISGNVNQSGTIRAYPRFVSLQDFALQSGSPCAGKGARVFSVAHLLATAP